MKLVKALFFDLDGTLQDSDLIWVKATQECLHDHGATITLDEAHQIVYGRGWREVFATMQRLAPELAGMSLGEGADYLRTYFMRLRDSASIAIPSSVALLRTLARRLPVAIVSGSPRGDIIEAIAHLDIAASVAFYLGAEDYPAGKPDPSCFLTAAAHLDIAPAHCLVFEDSTVGVLAAKRAGMHCVALARPGGPSQDVTAADLILSDLAHFDLDAFCAG